MMRRTSSEIADSACSVEADRIEVAALVAERDPTVAGVHAPRERAAHEILQRAELPRLRAGARLRRGVGGDLPAARRLAGRPARAAAKAEGQPALPRVVGPQEVRRVGAVGAHRQAGRMPPVLVPAERAVQQVAGRVAGDLVERGGR